MNENYKGSKPEGAQQTIKFFENLLRASADGIVITDATHNIIVVNEAFSNFFGRQRRDVVETNLFFWLEQLDTNGPRRWTEMENHIHTKGSYHSIDFVLNAPDGVKHISINASFVKRVGTEDVGVIMSIWRDVTLQRRAEEELRVLNKSLEHRVAERTAELAKSNKELLAEIEERKRAEERIKHHVQRLTALHMIDQAIVGSMDLHIVLNVLLEQVTTLLGVDAATVLLFNPHTQGLTCAASRGFYLNDMDSFRVQLGESYACRTVIERRINYISDLSKATTPFFYNKQLENEKFIAYYSVPLITKGQVKGVLEIFHRSPFNPDQEWISFFGAIGVQAAIAIDNAFLFDSMQRSNTELTLAYDTTIEGWSRALDLRDKETEGHSQRVTEMTLKLARALGVKEEELVHIRRGALLHDIGKMGIPDSILLKPHKLTGEEEQIIRKHPDYAYRLLSPIAHLRQALDIPYCHHEKWDGSGYPRGLKGEQIPLAARIFAIVDVCDALLYDRPYRIALSQEKTIEYLQSQAGVHFDPKMVETFLKMNW